MLPMAAGSTPLKSRDMKESPILIPQSTTATPLPSVSVLIPVRNAEATIGAALDSVLSQDYKGSVEVIVADGSDTPATSDLVRRRYPTVTLVPNPEQIITLGILAAHGAATGEIIVRCDAHTVLPPGYLRRAVSTLQRTGAANVGGRQQPVGVTFFGRAVAMAMTTPLGAGGARYRLGGAEGPVDTVFLGAFRRDALEAAGGVDPALGGAEDYELNWRLRARGETVWFDPGLVVAYRPRGTLRTLAWQYFNYGRWKRVVARRHPASLLPRHLASPLLLLGFIASPVLAVVAGASWGAAALPLAYLLTLALGSLAVGIRRRSYAALLLPLALATMHLSWGIGFFTPVRTRWDLTVRRLRDHTALAALPSVSVLIPVRNAEATIGAALDSVLSQDYKGSVEVIVADGSDTPATSDLVRRRYPAVTLVPNPEQTAGFGLRAAQLVSTGEVIVRCDAHSVFPPGYLRRAVSTLRRTGGGQCRRPATARRHHVLRARGGDGDDHSPGDWRRPLPTGRRGGARRHRLPGRVPARCVGGGGRRRPCLRSKSGLRTQLAAAGARGNGVVRSRARGRLPAPKYPAGSRLAIFQLRPMEADSGATTSGFPAAPASRQPAAAAGVGRLDGPGHGGRRLLGGNGGAAHVRPHPGARLSGDRHPSPFVRRAPAPAGPRNHAPELGNRLLHPGANQSAGRFDRGRCPFALKMLFLCCGGTELTPPLIHLYSKRLMFPESNSQIGTQRVTRHCLDPLENQHGKASFQ